MELFDLNSNFNNLFESSSIKDSLVNFLVGLTIKLCILPISAKMLKFSLAGLILINSQFSSFSNTFCLCISWPISLLLCPCSLTSIANLYLGKYASI